MSAMRPGPERTCQYSSSMSGWPSQSAHQGATSRKASRLPAGLSLNSGESAVRILWVAASTAARAGALDGRLPDLLHRHSRFQGRVGEVPALGLMPGHERGPGHASVEVEDPLRVVRHPGEPPGGLDRRDRHEVRWSLGRCDPLRHASIRGPEHADASVRPRLGGGPLDGVAAVFELDRERIEPPLGPIAATHVLGDDGKAGLRIGHVPRVEQGFSPPMSQLYGDRATRTGRRDVSARGR